MRSYYSSLVLASALAVGLGASAPLHAANIEKTKTDGPYRVELQVLPPEPFYTRAQVTARDLKSGMLVMGGAAPEQPGAAVDPNHHLIVHVFNRKTGQALTDARVTLKYQWVDTMGDALGTVKNVPVVVMQAIGHGAQSTHYGNNVSLLPGTYRVMVDVNGHQTTFTVTV